MLLTRRGKVKKLINFNQRTRELASTGRRLASIVVAEAGARKNTLAGPRCFDSRGARVFNACNQCLPVQTPRASFVVFWKGCSELLLQLYWQRLCERLRFGGDTNSVICFPRFSSTAQFTITYQERVICVRHCSSCLRLHTLNHLPVVNFNEVSLEISERKLPEDKRSGHTKQCINDWASVL